MPVERPGEVRRCGGNSGAIFLAASPDGRWAATGGRNGTPVRIWDLEANSIVRRLPVTEARLAFSPDGRWLVVGSPASYEFLLTSTWEVGVKLERDHAHLAGPMSFSSDGRLLALTHSDRDVRLVDTSNLATIATLTAPEALLVSCLAFSGRNEFLAVGTENRVIQLWDLRSIRRDLSRLGISLGGPFGE